MTTRYLFIEATETGFSAFSPELPSCLATSRTREVVEHELHAAATFHIAGLRLAGEPVPQPHTHAAYCETTA